MWHMESVFAEHNPSFFEKDEKHLLARGYVLYQRFERVYTPIEALKRGTAFEELDKPDFRKETAVCSY